MLTIEDSSQPSEADLQTQQEARKEGDQAAENIRYGQTISEGGMSGFTTDQDGEAKQGKISIGSASD